ncbi:BBE domain-containing protein [Mesorhizobium sp.]|uniref:BBE domain-containing protein n=1 Tax=Mesorhizobium sp. TaxID=1871066 RepID=UPI0025BDC56B|nr:BBE domain-containing protein [Mesorhizobium sp.]
MKSSASFSFRFAGIGRLSRDLASPILWDANDAGDVLRFYRDFVRDAPDELGTVVRLSYVALFHLKGAVSRVAEGETAFGNRQASHAITLDAVWRPGEDYGGRDTAWTREFFAALGRFREGVYVNFLGGDEDANRVREAYGNSVYDRLVDVKTSYDPDNVFHHNQNIRPRMSAGVSGTAGAGDT